MLQSRELKFTRKGRALIGLSNVLRLCSVASGNVQKMHVNSSKEEGKKGK